MAGRLKRRKDGRYAKQVTIGYQNGKPKRKSFYGRTIQEVEQKYLDFMRLYEKGVILEEKDLSFNEFYHMWYEVEKEPFIRENTKASYQVRFKCIENSLGILKIKDIRAPHIQAFINSYVAEGKIATARNLLVLIKSVFDYAVATDLLLKNPCELIKVKYTPKAKRALTDQEIERIESTPLSTKLRCLVSLLLYTGIRRGELFALSKDDFDFELNVIHIHKNLIDHNGNTFISTNTKTDKGTRVVPITKKLMLPLRVYLNTLSEHEYLFLNQEKHFYTAYSGFLLMENLRKKLKLPDDVTFHTFRHTFISRCYEAGVDVKKLQAWVGHADISTTLNVYTHLSKDYVLDCEEIDKIF